MIVSPSRFRLRRIFKGIVLTIARPLSKMGISPNTVTYTTLLFALIAFLSLTISGIEPVFGFFVFLVGLFDGVDGAVARLSGKQTLQGAFTDSFVDKVSEALLLLSIAVAYSSISLLTLPVPIWSLICYTGWILTSYTRAIAANQNVQDLDIGLGARSERLFILVVFSLFWWTLWGLVVVTIIGVLTAGYRFWHYCKEIETNVTIQDEEP